MAKQQISKQAKDATKGDVVATAQSGTREAQA
jgi:hypothetical protein